MVGGNNSHLWVRPLFSHPPLTASLLDGYVKLYQNTYLITRVIVIS